MAAPDPETGGFVGVLVGAATSLIASAIAGAKYVSNRLDKKADKHVVNTELQTIKAELHIQRTHIGKIFDQQRQDGQLAEQRHRELMMHMLKKEG